MAHERVDRVGPLACEEHCVRGLVLREEQRRATEEAPPPRDVPRPPGPALSADAQILAEALKANTRLTSLQLRGQNWLDDASAKSVADAICANDALAQNATSIGWDDDRIRELVAAHVRALWDEEKRGYPKLDEDEALAMLGEACVKGDLARAKAAVGGGADVHYSGFDMFGAPGTGEYNYRTAVHVAAINDHPELIRFLVVGAEADADARDTSENKRFTPCILACRYDKPRAVQALVEVNADVNRAATGSDRKGYTCLLYTSPSPRDGLLSRMPSSA